MDDQYPEWTHHAPSGLYEPTAEDYAEYALVKMAKVDKILELLPDFVTASELTMIEAILAGEFGCQYCKSAEAKPRKSNMIICTEIDESRRRDWFCPIWRPREEVSEMSSD